jgi:hypothetical protein
MGNKEYVQWKEVVLCTEPREIKNVMKEDDDSGNQKGEPNLPFIVAILIKCIT